MQSNCGRTQFDCNLQMSNVNLRLCNNSLAARISAHWVFRYELYYVDV